MPYGQDCAEDMLTGDHVHEFGAAKALFDLVVDECEKRGIERPVTVVACLGELTAYKKEPVLFYFDMLCKEIGGMFSGVELEIVPVSGMIRCCGCGKESAVSAHMMLCPSCGSHDVDIVQGREFFVKEIVAGGSFV
ncbi:MAG: hydrogenase maturation nickel metallochaperone HypA [archaeon]